MATRRTPKRSRGDTRPQGDGDRELRHLLIVDQVMGGVTYNYTHPVVLHCCDVPGNAFAIDVVFDRDVSTVIPANCASTDSQVGNEVSRTLISKRRHRVVYDAEFASPDRYNIAAAGGFVADDGTPIPPSTGLLIPG